MSDGEQSKLQRFVELSLSLGALTWLQAKYRHVKVPSGKVRMWAPPHWCSRAVWRRRVAPSLFFIPHGQPTACRHCTCQRLIVFFPLAWRFVVQLRVCLRQCTLVPQVPLHLLASEPTLHPTRIAEPSLRHFSWWSSLTQITLWIVLTVSTA